MGYIAYVKYILHNVQYLIIYILHICNISYAVGYTNIAYVQTQTI